MQPNLEGRCHHTTPEAAQKTYEEKLISTSCGSPIPTYYKGLGQQASGTRIYVSTYLVGCLDGAWMSASLSVWPAGIFPVLGMEKGGGV